MNIFKCKINFSMLICLMLMFSMVVIAEEQTSESSEVVETTEVVEETATEDISEPFVEEVSSAETTSEETTEVVDETISEEIVENTTISEEPINENNTQEESNETPEVEEISSEESIEESLLEENSTETIEEEIQENIEETIEDESTLIKTILNVILDKLTFIKGEILNIKAQLTYENESPVSNKEVDFYFDEAIIGSELTDDQGLADVDIDTSPIDPGTYIVKADYPEDDNLEASSDEIEITITAEVIDNSTNETVIDNSTIAVDNSTNEIVEETNETNSTNEVNMMIIDNSTNVTNEIIIEPRFEEILPNGIDKIEDCETEIWEEEKIEKTCTRDELKQVCDDELNTSCHMETHQITYECKKKKIIKHQKEECETKSYIINQNKKIDISGYKCSFEEDNEIVMICDSKFDGNGNGKCTSGESCMKFEIDKVNKDDVKRYEKNSRDDFIEEDDSFFLEREEVEVLE